MTANSPPKCIQNIKSSPWWLVVMSVKYVFFIIGVLRSNGRISSRCRGLHQACILAILFITGGRCVIHIVIKLVV